MRRYLGSKVNLINELKKFIKDNKLKNDYFIDAFSGSGTIAENFSKDYIVKTNDYMYFSKVVNAGILASNFSILKLKSIKKELNVISITKPSSGDFIYKNFSEAGGRKYFTKSNALLIDRIRQKIEDYYQSNYINIDEYFILLHSLIDSVQKVSNITGTYSAYLKKYDGRALKKMKFELIIPPKTSKKGHSSSNNDIKDFLQELPSKSLIYLDPPYTTLDYAGAYHLLETIALYDAPEIYGISGRRKSNKVSNFHKKTQAYSAFFETFKMLPDKTDVILSYSNHGLVTIEQIKEIVDKLFNTEIVIKIINHREYANINSTKRKPLMEYLIYFNTNTPIKAPYNYQGSKEKIARWINQIIPHDKFKTLIEPFSGGFNFGINASFKDIIINDLSKPSVSLLKYFYQKETETIIKNTENIIKKFKMKKKCKESFNTLRNKYNEDKDPAKLLVLLMFTYNFQIRFNSTGQFNNPVGLGGYSPEKRKQIIRFSNKIKKMNITFSSKDYSKIDFEDKNAIYYFDPPYLVTTASYNDGKRGLNGWNTNEEEKLLQIINKLHVENKAFILSNVIEHKGKINNILDAWIKNNRFKLRTKKYKNRTEILVYNF